MLSLTYREKTKIAEFEYKSLWKICGPEKHETEGNGGYYRHTRAVVDETDVDGRSATVKSEVQ
jgi:hypothetical protein